MMHTQKGRDLALQLAIFYQTMALDEIKHDRGDFARGAFLRAAELYRQSGHPIAADGMDLWAKVATGEDI